MQEESSFLVAKTDSPHKKARNREGQHFRQCGCAEDLVARIRQLEEEVTRKDVTIEKLKLDRDVSLDASTGPIPFLDQASYDGPPGYKVKMERTITHQNMLIENLQESLYIKEGKIETLSHEMQINQEQVTKQIKTLTKELEEKQKLILKKDKYLKENNDKIDAMKQRLEEEYTVKLENIKDELRKVQEEEICNLNSKHLDEIRQIVQSNSLKESFLEKQVELLSNRVSELYEMDVSHDTELEASRKMYEEELNELKIALNEVTKQSNLPTQNPLQEKLISLNNQLAEAVTNEVTLKAELNSCKKDCERMKKEFCLTITQLNEVKKNEKNLHDKCTDMEQSLLQCREDNLFLVESLKEVRERSTEYKLKYMDNMSELEKRNERVVISFNNDLVVLNAALNQLNDQINSVINPQVYNVNSSTSEETPLSSTNSSEEIVKSSSLSDINELLKVIRKSFDEAINIYDFVSKIKNDLEQVINENEELITQLSHSKGKNEDQIKDFELKLEALQQQLKTFEDEKLQLNLKIREMEKNTVDKYEYDRLLNEKDSLFANLKESQASLIQLVEKVTSLTEINNGLTKKYSDLDEERKEMEILKSQYESLYRLENEKLCEQKENLEIKLKESEDKLEQFLKNEYEKVVKENERLSCNLKTYEKRIKLLGDMNEELTERNNEIKKKLGESEKEKLYLERIKSQCDNSQHEYNKVFKEKEMLTANLKNFEQTLNEMDILKTDHDKILHEKEDLLITLKKAEDSIKDLELQNQTLSDKINEVEKKNNELTAVTSDLETRNNHWERENLSLNAQIGHSSQEIPKTQNYSDESLISNHSQSEGYKKFSHGLASTTFHGEIEMVDPDGGGEKIFEVGKDSNPFFHLSILKWMQHCQYLEKEKQKLIQNIEHLEVKVKDLEYGNKLIHEEVGKIQSKSQRLELRMVDYLNIKEQLLKLTENNRENTIRIQHLSVERGFLLEENEKLAQENILTEKKYKHYFEKFNEDRHIGVNFEIIDDMSKKIQDIVSLKEEIFALKNMRSHLLNQLEAMNKVKNCAVLKFEKMTRELNFCREELETVSKEKIDLLGAQKLLGKENEILNVRVNYLKSVLELQGTDSKFNLVEQMQQELLNLYKVITEDKYKADKLLIDKEMKAYEGEKLDARHRIDLILKSNLQLQNEKEDLFECLAKFQSLLHQYEAGTIKGGNNPKTMEALESDLIKEIRGHKEQHARIEEALRSTGNLHNDLQKQNDQLRVQMREIVALEKKLDEQGGLIRSMEIKMEGLQKDIQTKDELLKIGEEQKKCAEDSLLEVQRRLVEGEVRHEMILKGKDWKLQEAELRLTQAEVEKCINRFEFEGVESKCTVDNGISTRLNEYESEYANAIKRVRYYFKAQFAADAAETKEHQLEQIAKLHKKIKEQALEITYLVNGTIARNMSLPANVVDRNYGDLVILYETLERELNDLESGLDDSGSQLFSILRKKFQNFAQNQAAIAIAYYKKEHEKELEAAISMITQLHKEELELLHLKLDADKYNEIYIINQERWKSDKDKMNSFTQNISRDNTQSGAKNHILINLQTILSKHYFSTLQRHISHWNRAYKLELEKLSVEFTDKLKQYNTEVENALEFPDSVVQDIDKLLDSQNTIVSAAQNLIVSIEKEYNDVMLYLEQIVNSCHEKIIDCVKYMKSELSEDNNIKSLKEEVEQLKLEKEDLQQKHSSAIELLLADHKAEMLKTQVLYEKLEESGSSEDFDAVLSKQKQELEEKHYQEMEKLRMYFERKCLEIKKQYSEEIESQRSRQTSGSTSCSDNELGLDRLYTSGNDSNENSNSLRQCKTHSELERKLENLRKENENICYKYEAKIESLQSQLSNENYGNLLNSSIANNSEEKNIKGIAEPDDQLLQKSQQLDEMVAKITKEVEEDYNQEIRCIEDEIYAEEKCRCDKQMEEFKTQLSIECAKEIESVTNHYREKLEKEIEKVVYKLKTQEKENVWLAKLEVEERHKDEMRLLQEKLGNNFIDEIGKSITHEILDKVKLETVFKNILKEDIGEKLKSLQGHVTNTLSTIEMNLKSKDIRLVELQNKLSSLSGDESLLSIIHSPQFLEQIKQQMNWKSQNEIDEELKKTVEPEMERLKEKIRKQEEQIKQTAYKSAGQLEEKHMHEVEVLVNNYERIIKSLKEDYEKEVELLGKRKGSPRRGNDQQLQKRAQEQVINELVDRIVGLIEKGEETGRSDNIHTMPPELVALENVFASKYQRQLAEKVQEHALEVVAIRQDYDKKINALLKPYKNDEKDECLRETSTTTTGIKALDDVIKERDCLKRMTHTLKAAVKQLANYLSNCEDELNRTVIEELIKVSQETPRKEKNRISDISEETVDSFSLIHLEPGVRRVHFAPDMSEIIKHIEEDDLAGSLENSNDVSAFFRAELESCLDKLKLEAAALLGLSTLQTGQGGVTQEILDLKEDRLELLATIKHFEKLVQKQELEIVNLQDQLGLLSERKLKNKESVYTENYPKEDTATLLQDKVRSLLGSNNYVDQDVIKIIEDLSKEGDMIIEEIRREKDDLHQQVQVADKQLKNTRKFLEEQAAERENERDEFNKEVTNLQAQLRERDKDWTSRERFTSEVEVLEQQVRDTASLLKETQEKKDQIEDELKAAIDKVWVLRDIITDLESQVSLKSEREAALEQKMDELEAELEQQNTVQQGMLQELEVLRDNGREESYLEQIQQLQESMKMQYNSSVIRQINLQIREMEKCLEQTTKELEGLHVANSNNSLSSPSEEISIREQLESFRSKTPEYCPSPVALPVEEISKLQEKLQRHVRAEEVVVRRIRDQHMRIGKLTRCLEEMQAERDILQQQVEKKKSQLAEANNKIDDLRHKADSAHTTMNRGLIEKVKELQEKISETEQNHKITSNALNDAKEKLVRAEAMLEEQRFELKNLVRGDYEVVDSLRLELASVMTEKNKLEALVDRYRRELKHNSQDMPALMEVILADKNEDIEHLQETVDMLRSQPEERWNHCNSKGHRVSFAADVSSQMSEDYRLRDAPKDDSFEPIFPSHFSENMSCLSPILQNENLIWSEGPPEVKLSLSDDSRDLSVDQLRKELSETKIELADSSAKISDLQDELEGLKALETDLDKTKCALEATVASVVEDKQYYEEQLALMAERQKKKDEELYVMKDLLLKKDEDLIRTTADIKALQMILENLQEKLKEAKMVASQQENESSLKMQLNTLMEENEHLKKESRNLHELEEEIQQLKSNLESERQLCENLKDNMEQYNIEHENLCSEIATSKEENLILLQRFQDSQTKLEHYMTLFDTLKKELLSSKEESGTESKKATQDLENTLEKGSSDMLKLLHEISRLKSTIGRLEFERSKIQEELNNQKLEHFAQETATKQTKLIRLEQELSRLSHVIETLKETHASDLSKCNSKINKLQADVEYFKAAEQQVRKSLDSEIDKNKITHCELELSKQELIEERNAREFAETQCLELQNELSNREKSSASSREGYSGEQKFAGIEDLTIQVKKELSLSAQLDRSLLGTLQSPSSSSTDHPTQQNMPSEDNCKSEICESIKTSLSEKIISLENMVKQEKGIVKELERKLIGEEEQLKAAAAKTLELETLIDRLTRIANYQEDRITQISVLLEEEKNKVLTLELDVIKEKTNFKQLQSILEGERQKTKLNQQEDTHLIETLRVRLENSLDSETKLKNALIEVKQKNDSLEAQLNSVRAMEKYNSDSDSEHNKQLRKLLLQEKNKFLGLNLEAERLRRTCSDMEDVVSRERKAQSSLKEKLYQSEQHKRAMENELDEMRQNLKLEIQKREIIGDKMRAVEEADMRRSKNKAANQEKQRQALEAANKSIRELEKECLELREHVRFQQDHDDKWRDEIHIPLLHQLNEVNTNLELLVREKGELRSVVDSLKSENSNLQRRLNALQENIPERLQQLPPEGFLTRPDFNLETCNHPLLRGSNDENVKHLLGRYLRAESYRKALAWQKRYLLVALQGYQKSHDDIINRFNTITSSHRHKYSFKCVALLVVAVNKMDFLVRRRRVRFQNSQDLLLKAINRSSSRTFVQGSHTVERPLSEANLLPRPITSSPPSRDTQSSTSTRFRFHDEEGLLPSSTIAEYLNRFNEIQRRLGRTLEQTEF